MIVGNGKTPEGFQDHKEFLLLCQAAGIPAELLRAILMDHQGQGASIIRTIESYVKTIPPESPQGKMVANLGLEWLKRTKLNKRLKSPKVSGY